MSMHQNKGVCPVERALNKLVEAGKMASFTINENDTLHTSLRAAVWFLQALEGLPENHDPEAIAEGWAWRISYQYGTQKVVLGIYSIHELGDYTRGRRDYVKRKYKDAVRRVNRFTRLAAQAQKGGLAA